MGKAWRFQMKKGLMHKRWNILVITGILLILIGFGGITAYIDPVFHYHEPLEHFEYPLDDERYQNDGIVRHFNYNAIITGTSMTENFKTSECDELFGQGDEIISIKVPFAGAPYKEVNENLLRAFDANPNIKLIIRGLDYSGIFEDKDAIWHGVEDYGYQFPYYLTNDNLADDVNYLLNKEILLQKTAGVVGYTRRGKTTTTFDEYKYWSDDYPYGKEAVLGNCALGTGGNENERRISEEEVRRVQANIKQNVTDLVDAHPDVDFYIFFPPYSICYWDGLNQAGLINWYIDGEKCVVEELLKYPNIRLYSFNKEYEIICDLDNYRDKYHYGGWVNTKILQWMSQDEDRLTDENFENYIEEIRDFYQRYNYQVLHD